MSSFEEILAKAQHYCSYQERCKKDLTKKLKSWKVNVSAIEKVLISLEKDDYLNEKRFAEVFARGKLRNNHWGKNKIRYELRGCGLDSELISQSIAKIDDEEYLEIIRKLILRKNKEINEQNPFVRKNKILKYLSSKGFSYDESKPLLDESGF